MEMRYIIDLLRNSSEPDKNVHLKAAFIEVITRVFTAHIEKDRKPFEQYDPDATPDACLNLEEYLRPHLGRDEYRAFLEHYGPLFRNLYEKAYMNIVENEAWEEEQRVECELAEKEPENGVLEIGFVEFGRREGPEGVELYPRVFECAPGVPVWAPAAVVAHLCPLKWKWCEEIRDRAAAAADERLSLGLG